MMAYVFEEDEKSVGRKNILFGLIVTSSVFVGALLLSLFIDLSHIQLWGRVLMFLICLSVGLVFLIGGLKMYFADRGNWVIRLDNYGFFWRPPGSSGELFDLQDIECFLNVTNENNNDFYLMLKNRTYFALTTYCNVSFERLANEFERYRVPFKRDGAVGEKYPFEQYLKQQGYLPKQ